MATKEVHYSALITGNGSREGENWAIKPGQIWRETVGGDRARHVVAVEGGYVRFTMSDGGGNMDRNWWRAWARKHEAIVTPSGTEPGWFPRTPAKIPTHAHAPTRHAGFRKEA